jgi:hypothetical protein
VFINDGKGVPFLSSLNTTTALPFASLVLVSTSTPRPRSPAVASVLARNMTASVMPGTTQTQFVQPFTAHSLLLEDVVNVGLIKL